MHRPALDDDPVARGVDLHVAECHVPPGVDSWAELGQRGALVGQRGQERALVRGEVPVQRPAEEDHPEPSLGVLQRKRDERAPLPKLGRRHARRLGQRPQERRLARERHPCDQARRVAADGREPFARVVGEPDVVDASQLAAVLRRERDQRRAASTAIIAPLTATSAISLTASGRAKRRRPAAATAGAP